MLVSIKKTEFCIIQGEFRYDLARLFEGKLSRRCKVQTQIGTNQQTSDSVRLFSQESELNRLHLLAQFIIQYSYEHLSPTFLILFYLSLVQSIVSGDFEGAHNVPVVQRPGWNLTNRMLSNRINAFDFQETFIQNKSLKGLSRDGFCF